MKDLWILVADSSSAQIFFAANPRAELALVHTLEHAEARLHARDRGSDVPGRVHDRFGPARHSLDSAQQVRAEERHRFAREISACLAEGLRQKKYRELVVMAGPAFLGALRDCFTKPVAQAIVAEVPKDLVGQDSAVIRAHLP